MLNKGQRVTFGTGYRFGDVVLRIGEAVYTMPPEEAHHLSALLRESVREAQRQSGQRKHLCIACLRSLDEEDIVWYDPERRVLSTDTGHPYCVVCCPED